MKVVRRIHLYAGLVLLLPTLLYGLTALLFNHPTLWSERSIETLSVDSPGELRLGGSANPRELAKLVVSYVQAEGLDLQLSAEPEAQFVGSLRVNASNSEHRYTLSSIASTGETILSTRPARPARERAPFALRKLPVEAPWKATVEDEARAILAKEGADNFEDISTRSPRLEFNVQANGENWRASYDLERQRLSGERSDRESAMTGRSFLLRMHTAHGFVGRSGPRWLWAILVDVMGAAMILWASSGLLMWWQLRSLRLGGVIAIALGIGSFVALAATMHGAVT